MVRNVQLTICWPRSEFAKLTLAALIAVAAGHGMAQQDEGPILHPTKKPVVKTAGATLLVTCDLACTWKFDGVAMGSIDADGASKVHTDLGQHIVSATAQDGPEKFRQDIEIKSAAQTVLHVELAPLRKARLQKEPQSRNGTIHADQTLQEQSPVSEPAGAPEEEASQSTWTDPATKLMWAKHDNGDKSDLAWQKAMEYCRNLKLGGHADWRLPTIDELQGIYDASQSQHIHCCTNHGGPTAGDVHVKGNLQLSGWCHWSSSAENDSDEAWYFLFLNGDRSSTARIKGPE